MASTVKRAFRCLLDGLRSLPPRRRRAGAGAARRSSKAPRVVVIRRFSGKDRRRASTSGGPPPAAAPVTIRVATFNAAMFSMAPAVPSPPDHDDYDGDGEGCSSWSGPRYSGSRLARWPKKGILKAHSSANAAAPPPSPDGERRRHVSISLPDDEITPHHRSNSSASARLVTRPAGTSGGGSGSGSGRWRSVFGAVWEHQNHYQQRRQKQKQKQEREREQARATTTSRYRSNSAARRRSVADALREVGADMVALQNVRAEEGRGMRPLSELAEGLGMRYVFAESWAPEYGNAVLSRWPIKRWNARRLADHFDFRMVQERAESHHRGAGSRGGELVLHPSGPPRRGPQDEAGQLHPPLRRRPPPHPRRRPQRARRLRLLRRPLGRHRQVPRGDRQAAAEGGGDEAPQGEALRRRQGLRRRARSRPGGGSQRPRCAGDVQVRHEGGLHPGVAQLAVRLSAGVVRRRPVHGHLGSPHRHGGRRRRRGRGRRRRRRGGEAAAAAEGGEGDEQEFGERDIRRLD